MHSPGVTTKGHLSFPGVGVEAKAPGSDEGPTHSGVLRGYSEGLKTSVILIHHPLSFPEKMAILGCRRMEARVSVLHLNFSNGFLQDQNSYTVGEFSLN